MSVTLTSNSVAKINSLINLCPNTFAYVPFKIYKDENGDSFASIETIDVNVSVIFSGKTAIDNVPELDNNSGIIIRLPLSKPITNTLFNSAFTNLDVSKTRIIAKGDNKKITIALYDISNINVIDFPYTNNELFDLTIRENNMSNCQYEQFDINTDEIKEILDCLNILMSPTVMYFISNGKNIQVSCGDMSGNNVELKLDKDVKNKLTAKFDISITNILSKLLKFKDYDINMILSEVMAAITIKNDDIIATIGIPVAKE
jgi:hypothetical protein